MNLDKLKLLTDAAYTAFHALKGVEVAAKVSADDTATNKAKKVTNSVKHIAMAVDKALTLRR